MKIVRIYIAGILFCMVVGCGVNHSSEHFPGIGSEIPEAPPVKSGADGSGTVTFPDGTIGYSSTTGGYFLVQKIRTLSIGNGQTFLGLASDASNLYILIKNSDGGGIYHWLFEKLPNDSTKVTQQCSILHDNNFAGGLGWDGTNFYIGGHKNVPKFRKFNGSTCAESTTIDTGLSTTGVLQIAFDAGFLYFVAPWNGLLRINPSTASVVSTVSFSNSSLGGKEFDLEPAFSDKTAVGIFGGTIWGLYRYTNVYEDYLWKMDSSGKPIGWGTIPNPNIDALQYGGSFYLTAQEGVVTAGIVRSPSIYLITLDVSKF